MNLTAPPRVWLLDANLLIALTHASHVHHGEVHAWFEQVVKRRWASCVLTQLAFVRLTSNPRIVGETGKHTHAIAIHDLIKRTGCGKSVGPCAAHSGRTFAEVARDRLVACTVVVMEHIIDGIGKSGITIGDRNDIHDQHQFAGVVGIDERVKVVDIGGWIIFYDWRIQVVSGLNNSRCSKCGCGGKTDHGST